MTDTPPDAPTAAILVLGTEILSGRTKDANLGWLAERLYALGIRVREARVVPDVKADVVAARYALRLFRSRPLSKVVFHDRFSSDRIRGGRASS